MRKLMKKLIFTFSIISVLLIFTFSIVFFTSCSTDPYSKGGALSTNDNTEINYVSSTSYSSASAAQLYTKYYYNANNKIIAQSNYSDSTYATLDSTATYSYNGENLYVVSNFDAGGTMTSFLIYGY